MQTVRYSGWRTMTSAQRRNAKMEAMFERARQQGHTTLAAAVMTEEQIERQAERRMDSLDARLMAGKLSQAEYDAEVRELNSWAEEQYAKRRT